jgi:hypothetical protein
MKQNTLAQDGILSPAKVTRPWAYERAVNSDLCRPDRHITPSQQVEIMEEFELSHTTISEVMCNTNGYIGAW